MTGEPKPHKGLFVRFAECTAHGTGSPYAFVAAVIIVLIWAVLGPLFAYSDTWQLVINTGTTIITFLMVFLIQNTQNRDSRALHIKLDELLRAFPDAQTELAELEDLDDEELEALHKKYLNLAHNARAQIDLRG